MPLNAASPMARAGTIAETPSIGMELERPFRYCQWNGAWTG